MKKIAHIILPVGIVAVAILTSAFIVVQAQTPPANTAATPTPAISTAEQGITFPIPELGNCANRSDCMTYCNGADHMDACISFAKAHGLMNKEEGDRAQKFRASLQANGGPGGCTDPQGCEAFCGKTENLEACVTFAQTQGFKNKEVEEGAKVLTYIKSGGQLPGGCTSKESCQAYCGDFSHAEECYKFAQKAGIHQTGGKIGGDTGDIPPGQFQKFLVLAKNGQTPGACKSKDECENYCRASGHLDECLKFGQQVGFISSDQADKLQKLGGKGPGGCDSQESCSTYCNDSTHQKDCFAFAKEHGLIPQGELNRAKSGLVRLRAGLSQAPPEVVACLKSELGSDEIDNIQAGTLTPGPQTAEQLHNCFEKFGHSSNAGDVFKNAPPEVIACLKEKIGADFDKLSSGKIEPTPELADTFRVCFQKIQFQNGFQGGPNGPGPGGVQGGPGGPPGSEGKRGPGAFGGTPPAEAVRQFIKTAPPDLVPCIKEQLGDGFDKIQAGEDAQVDTSKLKVCFEKFQPQNSEQRGPNGPGFQGQSQGDQGGPGFQAGPQGSGGGFGGPGGCKTQEECKAYCSDPAHKEDCARLSPLGSPNTPQNQPPPQPPPLQRRGGICPAMPTVSECPAGQEKVVTFNSPECGAYYGCRQSGTKETACPSGQFWNGSSCAAPPPGSSDPATGCAKAGGTWTGTTCQMPTTSASTPTPSPSPTPSGSSDMATMCAKGGGTWTGTTCQMPTPTPSPTPSPTPTPTPSPTPSPAPSGDMATMCAKAGGTWTGTTCKMP